MRKLWFGAALAAVVIIGGAAPVAANTGVESRVVINGAVAAAQWSRSEGSVSQNAQILMAKGQANFQASSGGAIHYSNSTVTFQYDLLDCDADFNCSGYSIVLDGTDIPLTIDVNRGVASIDADVPGYRCDFPGKDCFDVTVHLAMTWTATGPALHEPGPGGSTGGEPGIWHYVIRGGGLLRDATVSGTATDIDLASLNLDGAWLQTMREVDVSASPCAHC